VLVEYCGYFNEARPHQGLHQLIPVGACSATADEGAVVAFSRPARLAPRLPARCMILVVQLVRMTEGA
jgi:hypothetical protein